MKVEMSDEEVLALRWLLDMCGSLDNDLQNNCPFVYHFCVKALKSLGGPVKLPKKADGLWDHPLAKKWYDSNRACDICGEMFPVTKLVYDDDGVPECKECRRERS